MTRGLIDPCATYWLFPCFCIAIIPQKARLVYINDGNFIQAFCKPCVNDKIQSAITLNICFSLHVKDYICMTLNLSMDRMLAMFLNYMSDIFKIRRLLMQTLVSFLIIGLPKIK